MRDKRSITFDEIRRDNDVFASLELVIEEDRCDILVKGISIATMNRKTHLALQSLSCAKMLKYTGMVPRLEFHQKLAAAAKPPGVSSPNLACTMATLIFGPRSVAETLAKDLSRYHLFLQHPYPMPTHVVYENPQYLGMVGSSFLNGAVLPPIPVEAFQRDTDRSNELDQDEEVDLVAVIDNLPRYDYLRQVDVDGRIRTALKR